MFYSATAKVRRYLMFIKRSQLNNTTRIIPSTTIKNSINVFEVGHSFPPAGYCSDPLLEKVFVIHYLVSGNGMCNGIPVSGPCIFVRYPNNVYSVDSSPDSPIWEQYWIKVFDESSKNLLQALGVSMENPIVPCNYISQAVDVFKTLLNSYSYKHRNDQMLMIANLYILLSMHSPSESPIITPYSPYTRTVCDYIHENYASIKNETELANIVHISVHHLCRLFKSDMNMTPIQYLINYRIKQASKLLKMTELSINAISSEVGFANANYFCNVFKKHHDGLSPKNYRDKYLSEKNT